MVIKVPYNLRLCEEVKIYQKMLRQSHFRAHVAPHTLEIASMFAIRSRMEPTAKCDLMTKLRLYNGEEVVEKGKTLKINVREALINMVKGADLPDDSRKQYLDFLQDTLHKGYLEILEKEITKAFIFSFEEQAETLFQNYLDHTEAYVNNTQLKDRNTGEDLQPDEGFLKSIEEQIAIIGTAVDGFRQEVMAYLWAATRRGERVTFHAYEPLKEAIEKKLMSSVRDMSRIITKSRTRDEEQKNKYDQLVKAMIDRGYNESSAAVVLKYAANHLWKD